MAFKLKKDVKKSSYYVWFLGSKESNGLRGNEYIIPILNEFIEKEKVVEPFKITLQISHKGIKIIQNISENQNVGVANVKKNDLIKHFIPQHSITCVYQHEDIVSMIMLLYNPITKCPLHVHAYRCDSVETATILTKQITTIIERPENVKKINEMELKMINKGVINSASHKYGKQNLSTRESETSGTSSGSGSSAMNDKVINLYDCLTAELKLKLSKDMDQAPILLPPRDYDTVRRKKGNHSQVDMRRMVGIPAGRRNTNNSSNSSGIGSDHANSPCSLHNDSTSDEDWNIQQPDDFEVEDPNAEIEDVPWDKNNREPPPLDKPWNRKNINTEWGKRNDEYIQNNLNNRNNRIDEVDNRYSKDIGRNVNKDIDIKRNIVNREYLPKESNRVERQHSKIEKDRNIVDVNRHLRRAESINKGNQIIKNKDKSVDRDLFVREGHKSNFSKTNSNSNLFGSRNEDQIMFNEKVPNFVKQMSSTQDQFEKNYDQRHIGRNYYENRQRSPSPNETSPRDRFIDAKEKFKLLEKERLAEEKKLIQQNIEKKIKEKERPISPIPINKNDVRRSWSIESEENKMGGGRVRNRELDDRIKRHTEIEIEERNRRNWDDEMQRKSEEREREKAFQEKERLARQRYKESQTRVEMGRYGQDKSSRESSVSKEYFGKGAALHQSKSEQISQARERSYQDLRHVSESPPRNKESPQRAYINFSRDSPTRNSPFKERPMRDSPTRSVSSWDLPLRESPARALPVESPSKKLSPREMLMRDAQEVRAIHDLNISKDLRDPCKFPAKEQLKKLSSRDSQSPIRESSRSSHSPVREYSRTSQSPVIESHLKYSPRNVPLESIPLERYRSPTRFDSPKSLGFEVSRTYDDSPRISHEVNRSFDGRGREVPSRSFDTYDIQGRGEISRHKILENSKKVTPDPIEEEKRRYSQELAKEFKRKSMLNLSENNSHVSSSSYQELQENERYPGLDKEPSRPDRYDPRLERERMSDDLRPERDPRAAQRFDRHRMDRSAPVERDLIDPRVGRDPRMVRDLRPEREYREHRDHRVELRDHHKRYERDPRFDPDPRLAQQMNSPRYRHSYAEAYHRDLQRTNSCLSSGRVGIASIHPY
uniref:Uncharacterized protein n=1 Tax=Cacopsylla melanoneura TaxID=428564 RepID=A0A8D8VBY0_9HEMI